MIATVWYDTDVDPSPPGGWTEILTAAEQPFAGARMFYRVASSEPANYSWTMGGDNFAAGVGQFTFRGVDTSNPILTAAKGTDSSPSSPVTAPEVVTEAAGAILTFCASYRDTASVIFHSSPDGGEELADFGRSADLQFGEASVSGALYYIEKDAGTYGFSVDLSGSGHDAVALFTVAMNGGANEGAVDATAPAASTTSSGAVVASGTLDASAPVPTFAGEGLVDVVRGDLFPTAPVPSVFMATDSTISATPSITAPLPVVTMRVLRDLFVTVDVTAPSARFAIGGETRIFGSRVVVVRPEPRTRYP